MNTYLIDADVLIRAHRSFYSMDVCPGFWDWLRLKAQDGTVRSVSAVRREIKNQAIVRWAESLPADFFARPSDLALTANIEIGDWVNNNQNFNSTAREEFMNSADRWLIAEARGSNMTVVTFETPSPRSRRIIKIPDVCKEFGVKITTLQTMLSREGARFVLDDTVRQTLKARRTQSLC